MAFHVPLGMTEGGLCALMALHCLHLQTVGARR